MPRILLFALAVALADSSGGGTVALWLFDEPAGAGPGSLLADAGPSGCALVLGPGTTLVPGKFGRALHPGPSGAAPQPAATYSRMAVNRTGGSHPSPTDTRLNLGAHDWTIECWLRIDRAAAAEATILELGSPGERALATRFSVLPAENAFAFAGISATPPEDSAVISKRVEYPNPEGPPAGVAYLRAATLALTDEPLPRDTWFHVALVHSAAAGELRLFLDGKPRAVASIRVDRLPHDDDACVSIGTDGRGRHPLSGAVDELRISDEAVYAREFTPPGSFGPRF